MAVKWIGDDICIVDSKAFGLSLWGITICLGDTDEILKNEELGTPRSTSLPRQNARKCPSFARRRKR